MKTGYFNTKCKDKLWHYKRVKYADSIIAHSVEYKLLESVSDMHPIGYEWYCSEDCIEEYCNKCPEYLKNEK